VWGLRASSSDTLRAGAGNPHAGLPAAAPKDPAMPITSEDAPLKQVRRRGRTWLYAALLVPLSGLLLLGLFIMHPQRIGPMVLSMELT